jgi:hypothetical protein
MKLKQKFQTNYTMIAPILLIFTGLIEILAIHNVEEFVKVIITTIWITVTISGIITIIRIGKGESFIKQKNALIALAYTASLLSIETILFCLFN